MNRLKQEPSESDIVEDVDEADGAAAAPASGLTNGHNHNSATELKPNVEVSLTEDSLQNVVPTYNNNNSIVPSQAYGGARPKTFRARLRSSESSSCRVRNSDSLSQVSQPVDIRVVTCDQEQSPVHDDSVTSVTSVPKLDTRHPNLRLSLPDHDISKDNIELDAGELVEDDCYIYTYIGGTAYLAADLPNSFFRLDSGSDGESLPGVAGAGQSNLSTGVAALIQDQMVTSPHSPRVRSFSPDQDFIEMDFDPGSDSDEITEDGDSGQGQDDNEDEEEDDEDEDEGETEVINDRLGAASVDDEQRLLSDSSPVLPVDSGPIDSNPINLAATVDHEANNSTNQPPITRNSPIHPASAPVLSPTDEVTILMPRSKSLNSSLGECPMLRSDSPSRTAANLSLCGSRLQQREAALFGGEDQPSKDSNLDLSAALQRSIAPETSSVSTSITPKAMIWKEKEAMRKQVTQTQNTSSCGAVALVNVMVALELDINMQLVAESVNIKTRRQTAPLPQYLLSRSEAGCTHADLISAVNSVARDRVRARFLPLYQRQFQLAQLLSNWISVGLVPVLTLNVQKGPVCPDGQLQDSWHHQMVWGVQGQEIFLANPLDVVSETSLIEQLDVPSELLIRRADIVSRFQSGLDLMEINRLGSRWRDMNVLGQVVNVMREERSLMKEEASSVMIESAMTMSSVDMITLTSHINIPASYTAGVTLFCLTSNPKALKFLTEIPDLPLKKL